MSEPILKALMQLFALIGDIHDDTVISAREKNIVRTFLSRHLNSELVNHYMNLFEDNLTKFNSERIVKGSLLDRKRTSLNAMRILSICEEINNELRQKQRIYVLIQLIDFISLGEEITENELDFLYTVAKSFSVPESEYLNIKDLIMNSLYSYHDISRVLVVDGNQTPQDEEIKHYYLAGLKGTLVFMHIPSTNTHLMRYSGSGEIYLNGQNIHSGQTYIFDSGSSLRGPGIASLYYTEVAGIISQEMYESMVTLSASNVTYRFRNSDNGIHDLNFNEESGRLVGILGGSGVGKSTTLSVLNGTLKPDNGKVCINGFDLYDEKEKKNLTGVIGFVPQDDLLIEELTVYQNLYYNAKLCLSNLPEEKLVDVVDRILAELDLEETRDLKVGSPLNKVISGGQRKRVNIALELLREPTILFVDEPTSGLSSVDSEIVMNLLKEQTYKGKLVIVNIHQPGSDIYKMFDRIMIIDRGGYQIFYGNTTEAIIYFRIHSNHANPLEDQCVACGNVNADQILQIVEAKIVDEHGRPTSVRKVSPAEWAERFAQRQEKAEENDVTVKKELPSNKYSIPGLIGQSVNFFKRDFLAKMSDKQYLGITLLGSPFLALLLAWFTRYDSGSHYSFAANENIPAYMFMCVITSMFFGLMVSSEEIVKDRKLLKRESFLNLSWFSYLNSKIMMMFLISAFQTFSFILIGNLILEIRGMTVSYWLVLFTTSCFANMLGLNISSAFNSVITIYIIIPFVIIPQLLFSGVLVKFDRLHKGIFASQEYVPVIGDMMTARWAFEALAVRQFKDNEYSRLFFKSNSAGSLSSSNILIIDELKNELWRSGRILDSVKMNKNRDNYIPELKEKLARLRYHIEGLSDYSGILPGSWINETDEQHFSQVVEKKIGTHLDSLKKYFNGQIKYARAACDSISGKISTNKLAELRERHENIRLTDLALDREIQQKVVYSEGKLISKFEPGYRNGSSKTGRAHFYAPAKKLGNKYVDTFLFNLAVIWIVTLMLYILLYFKLLRKFVESFGNLKRKSAE
jgi:ABC-type multidrug transport system ATPase subunit